MGQTTPRSVKRMTDRKTGTQYYLKKIVLCPGFSCHWQNNFKLHPILTIDSFDLSVMIFNNPITDGETQACSSTHIFSCEKRIKDFVNHILGNRGSVVLENNFYFLLLCFLSPPKSSPYRSPPSHLGHWQ